MTRYRPFAQASSCDGKTAFTTRDIADRAAKRAARRCEGKLAVYQCHHCGLYHVGNANPVRTRPRTQKHEVAHD